MYKKQVRLLERGYMINDNERLGHIDQTYIDLG